MAVLSELTVLINAEGTQAVINALRDVENAQVKVQNTTKQAGDIARKSGAGWQSSLSVMSGFGKQFIATGAEIATAASPMIALLGAVKVAADFTKAGAGMNRLEESSSALANSMGANMTEIMRSLRETSLGMVSDYDLMSSASRAMMLGISADADQMSQLLEVAALRGRAMGLSTTQAFNDIVTGIGRTSPLILDNLGIVMDADTSYANYAQSIGKTVEELSKAEKQQALLNGVLESTAPLLASTGGLLMDQAGQWERLTAQSKNFFDNLKKNASEFGSGDGSSAMGYVEGIATAFEGANLQETNKNILEYAHRIGLLTDAEYNWTKVPIIYTYEKRNAQVAQLLPLIEDYEKKTKKAAEGTKAWTDRNYESAESMAAMEAATARAALEAANYEIKKADKIIAANEAYFAQNAAIIELETNMQSAIVNLGTQYTPLLTEIGEKTARIADLQEIVKNGGGMFDGQWMSAKTATEEIEKLRIEIENTKISMEGMAAQAVAGIAWTQITKDGEISLEEVTRYYDYLVQTGIMTAEAGKQAIKDFMNYWGLWDPEAKELPVEMVFDPSPVEDWQPPKGKVLEVGLELDDSEIVNWQPPSFTATVNFSPGRLPKNPWAYADTGGGDDGNGNALGGPVYPNKPYTVGERGIEGFVPSTYGHVITNADIRSLLSNGGAGNGSFEIDYRRLGNAVTEGIIIAAEDGRLGNNVYINSNKQERVAATFDVLRAYGGNY